MAAAAVAAPASSDTRAPHTRRERRSRPNSSVPRGWPGVKRGRSRFAVSTVSGSARGRWGARQAASTTPTRTRRARRASRFRPARLFILDARIEVRVEEIDGEVDQHEGEGDDEHAALHEREIAGEDALDHEEPYPRPREDGLREHGAAQQIARLHAHHGHDGDEGILEPVTED